jgi:uncharacterized membrane protein (UPF0127 family)
MKSPTRLLALLLAATAVSLGGCSGNAADGPVAESGLRLVPLTITQGQQSHRFTVEVAATPSEQQRGLMMRTSLAPDRGMIFPFDPPKFASFWMKDTLIPLDLFFIRADGTIDRIAENTVPESLEPVVSGGEVAAVLELAGGTAARLGIDESATVRWDKP